MIKNPIYTVLLIASLSAASAAQTTTRTIDSYAKGIDRHTASKKNVKVVFADVSDHNEGSKAT